MEMELRPSPENVALWWETLRRFEPPRADESLAGYALRLDAMNNLNAGESLIQIRRYPVGLDTIATPMRLLTASSFDLGTLSRITGGVSLAALRMLTLQPVSDLLHPHGEARIQAGPGEARTFQMCPRCVQAHHLPLAPHLGLIGGCASHALAFVSSCRCGESIRPFRGQTPFTCHRCGADYGGLPREPIAEGELSRARALDALLREAQGFEGALDHSGRDLAEAVRLLSRAALLGDPGGWQYKRDDVPTVRAVLGMLLVTGNTLRDLVAAIERTKHMTETGERGPRTETLDERRCPNEACGGTRISTQGRCSDGLRRLVCARCGTTFNRKRVLFSFDPIPGFPAWRVERNRTKLERWRLEVRRVAHAMPAERYLYTTLIFKQARVPVNLRSFAPRQGLVAIVEEVARERGLLIKRAGVERYPINRRAKALRHRSAAIRSTQQALGLHSCQP